MQSLVIGAVLAHLLVRPWSQTNAPLAERVAAPGAPVGIVLAKDEYEPGSFLLYPRKDLGKVRLLMQ